MLYDLNRSGILFDLTLDFLLDTYNPLLDPPNICPAVNE